MFHGRQRQRDVLVGCLAHQAAGPWAEARTTHGLRTLPVVGEVTQSLKEPQLPPRVGARVVVVMTGMKTGERARIPATREPLAQLITRYRL